MNGANITKECNKGLLTGGECPTLTWQEKAKLSRAILGRGNLKATAIACKTDPLTIKHVIHGGFSHKPETINNIRSFLNSMKKTDSKSIVP